MPLRCLGLLFLFAASSLQAAPLPLASAGKAQVPIIISPQASETTRQTAAELALLLEKITTAPFQVRTGDGSTGIVLGTIQEFPQKGLEKDLEIRRGFDGKEAFAIRTERNRLLLLGATDLGASHAAFRFLEKLGYRHYFPAREWEVIPRILDLKVDYNETDRPQLLSRNIWYGFGFFDRAQKRTFDDYKSWSRHNRMGQSLSIYTGHAWQSIILSNKKTFEAHPEYLALVKGERRGEQLCVSNPAVRELAIQWALDHFKKKPEADMVSMETSDGLGQCECERCKKLGSISDRAFGLANDVARRVAKEFPGKMVGMLAYSEHSEPPSFPLEPNIYVQLTAGFIRGKYSFDELKDLWPKLCKNMGFYEYLSVWPWDWDMPASGRAADLGLLQNRIRDYADHQATSLSCESSNNWGPHGLGYYVANKLMWNPRTDVEALKQDFFKNAFGPADRVMARYYDRFDPGQDPIISEHLLALALRDLDEAGRLAKDRADVQTRLDHLKQYLHYVRLKWDLDRTRDLEEKKDLALKALTHCYRTRYSYMNHWAAMQFSWSAKLAKDLKDPRLEGKKPKDMPPWKIDTPMSPEETARLFQEDLKRFQPQEFQVRTFSRNLAPAGLTSAKPAETYHRFQSPGRYALYSVKGEPLEGSITTGLIAGYRDRPQGTLSISDEEGRVVHQEKFVLDGQDHPFRAAVKQPGLYWLHFHDSGAAWALKMEAGRPCVFVLEKKARIHSLGQMPRVYFFVPKGTEFIDYFLEAGPQEVMGPDGKAAAKISERGKYIRVAVPKGMDGQAWSIQRLNLGRLWFTNLPNYLAASPEALLVPREALPEK